MVGLPELPEGDLRRIEKEELRIALQVRQALVEHGETGVREIGVNPNLVEDWLAIHARRLMRLYAIPYLRMARPDRIHEALTAHLLSRVREEWFAVVKPERADQLLTLVEATMRDEFANCGEQNTRPGNANMPPAIVAPALAKPPSDAEHALAGGPRRKPGPKPATERYNAILDVLQRVYEAGWRSWRQRDLYLLSEALDDAGIAVPNQWRKREPKRTTWVDGWTERPEDFRKAVDYAVEQAVKSGGRGED